MRHATCPRREIWALVLLSLAALPSAAQAHWCHDLWGSSYNIVVRPEADEVVVPSSGDTDLVIYVQNNMGYPLVNFDLDASASGYSISVSRAAPKVSNYLMPGEKLRHTLTISRSGGATLQASEISFSVAFGNSVQDDWYPYNSGEAVMMKLRSGGLAPSSPPSLGEAHGQALQLGHSTVADYGTTSSGLDDLLQLYCAGRGSWGTGGSIITSHCSSTSATSCPSTASRSHTKYDYQHLWGAEFLAARKSGMSAARRDTFRERLMCGYDDDHFTFKAFAAMMLGYMGPEGGSDNVGARAFLQDRVSNGSADEQAVAKAALLLYGNSGDVSAYHGDVTSGLSDGNAFVECASAAALGIVDGNDAAVEAELVARARWTQPDTGNNGRDFYCAHLLDLVAWHRRAWAPDADDTGVVSFFEGEADTVAPAAPGGVSCTPQSGGRARIDWNQVTLDVGGDPENVTGYRVYYGTTARPGSATRPGEQGFDYDHVDPTSGIYLNASGLTEGETYYFTVTALDASSNHSVYSTEVSCDIPLTNDPPVASLSCAPTSGDAPLHVVCDGTGSSDPDGAGDLAHYYFNLDGAGEAEETDGVIEYDFASAGSHSVVLRVVDQAGLDDTDSVALTVTAPAGENQPPSAQASAAPESGYAPLEVTLSASGSSDPDGDNLSYSWDFGDGSAVDTSADTTHSYSTAGTYTASLTVTDDGSPPLTGVASVVITVTEATNAPPEISSASATPLFGPATLDVHFDATGVYDPDGDNFTLTWDFGDGSAISSEAAVDHSYDTDGQYTATLSAQDDGTPTLPPATASFTISVTDNLPPERSAASVTPLGGPAPLTINMDASACTDPDGDNVSASWIVELSMDESVTYGSATATHTFTAAGDYDVTVTLRDDGDPPLEVTRAFLVEVGSGDASGDGGAAVSVEVGEGCACAAAHPAQLVLPLLLVVALGAVLRRRQT